MTTNLHTTNSQAVRQTNKRKTDESNTMFGYNYKHCFIKITKLLSLSLSKIKRQKN